MSTTTEAPALGPIDPDQGPDRRRDPEGTGPDAITTPPPGSRADRRLLVGLAVVVWALVLAVGRAWGLLLHERGVAITLYTPPVLGGYRPSPPSGLVLAAAVAAVLVVGLPPLVERLRWGASVVVATAAAAGWWVALAAIDGADGFTRGLEWEREWAPHVGDAGADPAGFLASFVDRLPEASVQVRGHPPGVLLATGALDRLGLATPGPVAALSIAGGLAAVVAVLLTVRLVVDEGAARRVLPFLVLAPAATWLVTSFDAAYAGVTAWFLYLLARAMTSAGRRRWVLAVGAGVLAAVASLLSYGMVLLALPAVALAFHLKGWRVLVATAAVAWSAVASLALVGFWWFDGLAATRHEYEILDVQRPYEHFLVANLSAWALAIGPAVVAGVVLLRDRRAWVLVGGALAAAGAADLSGLSEGEVERIWLPFTVWAFVATAALPAGRWVTRIWLSAQAAVALGLNAVVRTYW